VPKTSSRAFLCRCDEAERCSDLELKSQQVADVASLSLCLAMNSDYDSPCLSWAVEAAELECLKVATRKRNIFLE
jgi:hypothetical protein